MSSTTAFLNGLAQALANNSTFIAHVAELVSSALTGGGRGRRAAGEAARSIEPRFIELGRVLHLIEPGAVGGQRALSGSIRLRMREHRQSPRAGARREASPRPSRSRFPRSPTLLRAPTR